MIEEVKNLANLLYSILNNQGSDYKTMSIIQILRDFRNTSTNQMNKDLREGDYSEVDILRSNIKGYINIIDVIEDRFYHSTEDFQNALKESKRIYNYYEQKYIRELNYRNEDQKLKYIEEILSPLMLVNLFLEEIIKK